MAFQVDGKLHKDRCEIVEDYKEGDDITVHFNLRGREWNDRYFTNLDAWRIENTGPQTAPGSSNPEADYPELTAKQEDFSDDVPF